MLRAAPWVGATIFVVGLGYAFSRAPRFVWLNSGVHIAHLWPVWAAAVLAGLGAGLAAWSLRGMARKAGLALAVLSLASALHLALYDVGAENAGLSERGLFGTTTLAWKDVSRVDSGTRWIFVWGKDESRVRVDAASFNPEDRARLDRTIARRVKENTGR